jgi:hypothetical protein
LGATAGGYASGFMILLLSTGGFASTFLAFLTSGFLSTSSATDYECFISAAGSVTSYSSF